MALLNLVKLAGVLTLFIVFNTLLAGVASQEATDAQIDGTVRIQILGITVDQFEENESVFRDVVAIYSSRYCKLKKDNCWTTDKQIRYHDVVVSNSTIDFGNVNNVLVDLYITDRFVKTTAALEKWQLAAAFNKYDADIEASLQRTVTVVVPVHTGLYGWEIAVIVVCSVIGVVIIVSVSVAETQKKKKKRAKSRASSLSSLSSRGPGAGQDTKDPGLQAGVVQRKAGAHTASPPPYEALNQLGANLYEESTPL